MTQKFPFKIETVDHEEIQGSVTLPSSQLSIPGNLPPCIILVHSLFGDCQDTVYPSVSEALVKRGLAVLQYRSHSSSYESRNRFNKTTLSRRSDELGFVLTALFERMIEPRGQIDIRKLGVYGHEFGASVALNRAVEDSRIGGLLLSSILTEPSFSETSASSIRPGPDFESDWHSHGKRHLARCAENLKIPVSLLAGTLSNGQYLADSRQLFFRQPTLARLKTLDCDEKFAGKEARLAKHCGDFFSDQFLPEPAFKPSQGPASSSIPKVL
jgi:hypothetical protein